MHQDMENHGYPVPSLSDAGELVKPEGFEATQAAKGWFEPIDNYDEYAVAFCINLLAAVAALSQHGVPVCVVHDNVMVCD